MTDKAHYEIIDQIAVITLNSPPVNGLGQPLRQAIKDGMTQALADESVNAIVIASANKLFCGGADISEFGSPLAGAEPSLPDMLIEIEASDKLVIAAINGAALGGGCELTLACDYRYAHPKAKLGLPEVHLGILPGAGGTQRLPRLAGVETALKMITGGAPLTAKNASSAGIVDQLDSGEGNFLDNALSYVQSLVSSNAPRRNCAEMAVDTSQLPDNYFAEFRKSIARRTRGSLSGFLSSGLPSLLVTYGDWSRLSSVYR